MNPRLAYHARASLREFVGKQWLTYLLIEPTISWRLRIRHSDLIFDGKKQFRASVIFGNLKPGPTQVLFSRRLVWGRFVYICALRLDNGELLIVVSGDSPSTAISDYGKRWGIETLLGMFKTRGFCLESTHFTNSQRLSKLLALMSLALCWAIKMGEWLHQHQPVKVKKHGRLAKSIFPYGDEADNHLVELATAGNAQIIVTKNVNDFKRSQLLFPQIKILKPEQVI